VEPKPEVSEENQRQHIDEYHFIIIEHNKNILKSTPVTTKTTRNLPRYGYWVQTIESLDHRHMGSWKREKMDTQKSEISFALVNGPTFEYN
jgi:hypothetical protein